MTKIYYKVERDDGFRVGVKHHTVKQAEDDWYKHQELCSDCRQHLAKVVKVTVEKEVVEILLKDE